MARVMIVDDDAQIRYIMRIILERAGHDVTEAVNGATALDAIHHTQPDIVITDLVMPVMSGQEMIARLRADPAGANVRVLVVSAYRIGETGANGWVDKPFHPNRLVNAVQRLLERQVDTPQPS